MCTPSVLKLLLLDWNYDEFGLTRHAKFCDTGNACFLLVGHTRYLIWTPQINFCELRHNRSYLLPEPYNYPHCAHVLAF